MQKAELKVVGVLEVRAWGSIPLNIHEVHPHPFWGEPYRRKKIPVDHFIGHTLLLYKKLIKDQGLELQCLLKVKED